MIVLSGAFAFLLFVLTLMYIDHRNAKKQNQVR